MKIASPSMKTTFCPTMSASDPAASTKLARVSAYASITHWRSLKSAPRSRSIDGNATFTIVTSSSSMKIAVQLTSRVHHLRSTAFRNYTGYVAVTRCQQWFT